MQKGVETLFFFYNLMITVCFVLSAAGFLLIWWHRRQRSILCLALVFFLFTADNLVLYMRDLLPGFSGYYALIDTEPYLLNFLTLLIIFIYRRTILSLRESVMSNAELGLWSLLMVAVLAVVAMDLNLGELRLGHLLLHTASVLVFAHGVYEMKKRGNYPRRRGVPPITQGFLLASLALELLALLEYILAQLDIVILPTFHRILGIELLSVLYSCSALAFIGLYFARSGGNDEQPVIVAAVEKPAAEPLSWDEQVLQFARGHGLTSRERELLPLMLEGKTNAEISVLSCISEGTVKSHTHNIYQKLGVKNRAQIALQMSRFSQEKRNG